MNNADMLKFIVLFYTLDKEKTLKQLIEFINSEFNEKLTVKLSSSNKSLILLSDKYVYKLMKPIDDVIDKNITLTTKSSNRILAKYNKETIPAMLNCLETCTICIKKILITPFINIIKYERLKPVKKLGKMKNFLIMLYDVAVALKNVHKAGYSHNDVYIENIGCRHIKNGAKTRCQFVLYDFELAKRIVNKSEEMMNDVVMFLEDLISRSKNSGSKYDVLKRLLSILESKYKTDSGKCQRIGKKEYVIYSYTYKTNSFEKLVIKEINEYVNKKVSLLHK